MAREALPYLDKWEREGRIPREVWKKLGDMGLLGLDHPAAFGGLEADFFSSVVFLEELAKTGSGGFSAAVSVHSYMATAHLSRAGSPELKARYLAPAIAGDMIGALAISEPAAGSDVAALRCSAQRDGDHYLINGSKTFITNGVYSDFIVVACKTQPNAGAAGISLIVVDRDTPGVSANLLHKIGWHSSDTGEIFFQDVRVPVGNLIGEENRGFFYIMDSFQVERLVGGILANAGSEWAMAITLRYMQEREAFGRSISKYQVLRHRFVQLATELEASKQLAYHASWLQQQGAYAVKEASMVKLYASELGVKIAHECLQFFGGYGYIEDFPIARAYRDARVGTIAGGTSEIMCEILAKILIDDKAYRAAYEGDEKTANIPGAREIIESIPLRFRPEKAGEYSGAVFFDLSGPEGGQWTVRISEGLCHLDSGQTAIPTCIVSADAAVYADLELGRIDAQQAVLSGKLKVSNLMDMMQFIRLFRRATPES